MTTRRSRTARDYETRVGSLIQADVSLVIRGDSGDNRFFVDGHRVLNPADPICTWRLSARVSPSWIKMARGWCSFYKPRTIDAAERVLRRLHAGGIMFTSQPAHAWPFPSGVCWVRLDDNLQSWAAQHVRDTFHPSLEGNAYLSFIGDKLYQDGAKFSSSCERHVEAHQPYMVAIDDDWLVTLAERLGALLCMEAGA